MYSFPSKEEMNSLITIEFHLMNSKESLFFETKLIPLQRKELKWEYGKNEAYDAWVFADLKERDVGVAYCLGGFGSMGSPWGLIFFHNDNFGMDCGWYPRLKDLIKDGWLEENS